MSFRAFKGSQAGRPLAARICLGSLLLLAIACGGGGGLDSVENRISVRLERNGATTTSLDPGATHPVVLRVTSQDAALHFFVTFKYDEAHFEPIAPIEVFIPANQPQDIQFELVTKSLTGVNGEIDMELDVPANITTEPLVYTIDP